MHHDLSPESALTRLIDLFVYSSHSNAARRRFETATGLSMPRSEIQSLNVLSRGPRAASELAAALHTDVTQSSRQVAALARRGFVTKSRASEDRRHVLLTLTGDGDDLMRRWQSSWKSEMRRPLETWSGEDIDAFTEWLRCAVTRLTPVMIQHGGIELFDLDGDGGQSPSSPADDGIDRCGAAIADIVYLVGRTDFEDMLRAADITLSAPQYFVLADVEKFGPTTVSALAARLDLGQSAASRSVSALADEGLVQRAPSRTDGRSRKVSATVAGTRLLGRAQQSRLDDLTKLFADVDPDTGQRYAALTDRYLDELLTTADSAARRYSAEKT